MAGTDGDSIAIETDELDSKAWSVARLNSEIETVLREADDRFPTYVIGEISEVSTYGFGTFFELRDLEKEAVVSCIAWAQTVANFEHSIEQGTAAIVRAAVDFYADRGDTQLVVSGYWPVGEADRTRKLEKLRSQLESEGLFDDDRKQSLPEYPACIGVVTSLSGSAREDFVSAARARSPGVTIKLCGATVQGENAVPSLVGAIRTMERESDVDVAVVTRGGGSDADLWCFNEEPVVRSIADCSTPLVVAIGHEDDETLSEAVADRRAMTPTDAGIETTPNVESVRESVGELERRVESAYTALVDERVAEYERRIAAARTVLEQRVAARHAMRRRAADLEMRLSTAYDTLVADRLTEFDQRLETALQDLEHAAKTNAVTTEAARGRFGDLEARIDQAYRRRVEREIDVLETRIETAYRDVETDARIEAGTVEARRLRIIVAVLLALLLLGSILVGLFLL